MVPAVCPRMIGRRHIDWSLGLVFNSHILPINEHGEEHILEGPHMVDHTFMQV